MAKSHICRNFTLMNKDKFAENALKTFIKSNGIFIIIFTIFYTSTHTLVFILDPLSIYTNINL